jgi:sorbitol-specific phosphotransferase system component IIC
MASSVVRMIGCMHISILVMLLVCIPNALASSLCVMPSRFRDCFSATLVTALHYVVSLSKEVNPSLLLFVFRFGDSVLLLRSR